MTTPSTWPLPASLSELGPNVVGATGGSGTRVLARIVRSAGMFIGETLNDYEDALPFAAFSDRWINTVVDHPELPADAARQMSEELRQVVAEHCAELPAAAARWGWKEPRSIYLVPFLAELMPSLRFVHFIRDGRDMAFSDNQTQLRKHGDAVLRGTSFPIGKRLRMGRPLRSITLWTIVNTQAADYGEAHLGDRYLRVRFEDLCAEPVPTAARILEHFRLPGAAAEAASSEVKPPATLGRWQGEAASTVSALEDVAGPALDRFGYR